MSNIKSSSDKNLSGGVGGAYPGEGEDSPQQEHLFWNTEPLWRVVETRKEQHWNEQAKMFMTFVTYVKTEPLNWVEPEPSDKLPWEE